MLVVILFACACLYGAFESFLDAVYDFGFEYSLDQGMALLGCVGFLVVAVVLYLGG